MCRHDKHNQKNKTTRAIISVYDKTAVIEFATTLNQIGVEIISTGGTAQTLDQAGIAVTPIEQVTNYPEMLDGRVKTLHPAIHGAILANTDINEHQKQIDDHNINQIDIVAVNLYPFAEVLAAGGSFADLIENIDIGGVALIRSAAKNHARVAVIVDNNDYDKVGAALSKNGEVDAELRRHLAAKAFNLTAHYDTLIANWLAQNSEQNASEPMSSKYVNITGSLASDLRYGENPQQRAAFYQTRRIGIGAAELRQGKKLSYNNINDADAALNLVNEFSDKPCAAIIKHANPCGIAVSDRINDAYTRAIAGDPISAFGGIVAVNRSINRDLALAISRIFTEVVIAPDIEDEAAKILATKPNVRILLTHSEAANGNPDKPNRPDEGNLNIRSITGGLLVQTQDTKNITKDNIKVVSEQIPTAREMADLLFAFKVVKHVKSNAIVIAGDGASIGIGAGQMSRIDALDIAIRKASVDKKNNQNYVVASDAFFPFADSIDHIAKAGIKAIIQPGGSIRDAEVIKAANDAGIAMVFTGIRHFLH